MKRVNYHLTERQIKRLQIEAKKTGLSVAEIIRRSLDEYFEKRPLLLKRKRELEDESTFQPKGGQR